MLIDIHAQPNGKKTEIQGVHGDRLKIRIHAPPVDGKANEEIISFFSLLVKIPKRNIQIVKGETSREKTVLVQGVSLEQIKQLINLVR